MNREDVVFMRRAIEEMRIAALEKKTGGPFGAVIVLDGKILAAAGNRVLKDNDPTAHAEMNAIREAAKVLGRWDLSGATLYTTGECCPMCYAAARWARIDRIVYASSCADYADLYADTDIYEDIRQEPSQRSIKMEQLLRDEAAEVWKEFRDLPEGARY